MAGQSVTHYVVQPAVPQAASVWRLRRELAFTSAPGAYVRIRVHVPSGHAHQLVPALAHIDHAVRAVTAVVLLGREPAVAEPGLPPAMPMLPPQLGGVDFVEFTRGDSWTIVGELYDAAAEEFGKAPLATLAALVALLGAGPELARSVATEPAASPPQIVLVAPTPAAGSAVGDALPPAGTEVTFATGVPGGDENVVVTCVYK